ncbi:MAG TPA: anthranilate phosphoribosyltransferase [Candidatus Eremiobacteraceae bacterium]
MIGATGVRSAAAAETMTMCIRRAVRGEDLSMSDVRAAVEAIVDGEASEAQVGALLAALATKGETADELAGAADALRERMLEVHSANAPLLDVCGTGGDGSGSFNISTAVAFVAAGAGATVAKHGNRAMSSRCGSADVLSALGVRVDASPATSARALEEVGIAFLFAQAHHPAMRAVGPARREIGIRSIFNLVGPLANPARAQRQVVGVADERAVRTVAEALRRLGSERAAAVRGHDGMDEVSLSGPTRVVEWTGSQIMEYEIDPASLGLERSELPALRGGDADENAHIVRTVFAGGSGPQSDVIALNAALALVIAGIASDLRDGLRRARFSIASGAAATKLAGLVRVSTS